MRRPTLHLTTRAAAIVLGAAFCIGCRARSAPADREVTPDALAVAAPPPPAAAPAQISSGIERFDTELRDSGGHRTSITLLRVDLEKVDFSVIQPPRKRLESLAGDTHFEVVVNGGFFAPDSSPSGLLVDHAKVLAPQRSGGGSGILVVAEGRAKLFPSNETHPEVLRADLAVQCGPRLIEPDGSVGIHDSDGKRAARTMACIRDRGRNLDIVLAYTRNGDRDGPVLLDAANWLSKPILARDRSGCEAALNLDGGPSTGVLIGGAVEKRPFGPVPWAIALSVK